jgi:hypothetical protein
VSLVWLTAFTGARPPSLRACAGLGSLVALTFLARLDTVLLFLIVLAAVVVRQLRGGESSWPRAGPRVAALLAPLVVAVALYVAVNFAFFGHAVPVSAAVKRAWSDYVASNEARRLGGWVTAKAHNLLWPLRHLASPWVFALVVGSAGAASLAAVRRGRLGAAGRLLDALAVVIVFSVVQLVVYALAYHGTLSYAPWYYVAQPFLTALIVAGLVEGAADAAGRRWLATIAALCTAGLVCWRAAERATHEGPGGPLDPLYAAARWTRENVPPGARVGAWNAGTLAYLAERDVVNLDGLVNSWDYFLSGRHDLCRYFDEQGITYLVDAFEWRDGRPVAALVALPVESTYARCGQRFETVASFPVPRVPWRLEALRLQPPTPPEQ